MHSSFVLAEKTLGAPNFASCGHQTGALPPISALPIYPHTATAGDAQMRLPGPLTSPEPTRPERISYAVFCLKKKMKDITGLDKRCLNMCHIG